ncbi:MAG: hypothetical protein J6N45_08320 [Alphaproteobacteria bacterium]|nr:hypothetical protein [Alphaproteobacteria bacterium]
MEETLLNIYGAKVSQDGKRVVLTLIQGDGQNKKYFNACVKLETSNKVRAKVDEENEVVFVRVPLLKPKAETKEVDFGKLDEVTDDEVPF